MNNRKRRLELISLYDHTGIERQLKKMAEKGWMLESIGTFGWIYRRTEPKYGQFSVTYYPKASEFDPEPSEGQRMYQEFTTHSGWEFVCSNAQIQVFYTGQDDPTPIETDPVTQVENIHQAAKKSCLLSYFLFLALSILNGSLLVSQLLDSPISVLSSSTNLFSGVCWVLLLLLSGTELTMYYLWLNKARKAAEHGEFVATPNSTQMQRFVISVTVIVFAIWLIKIMAVGPSVMRWSSILMLGYMITLIFIVNTVKQFLKRKKFSRGANLTITLIVDFVLAFAMMGLVVYLTFRASDAGIFERNEETYEYQGATYTLHQDGLPLDLVDLIETDYTGFVREWEMQETSLLAMASAYQHPRWDDSNARGIPSIEYNIAVIKAPFLYDLCKNAMLEKYDPKGSVRFPQGYEYIAVEPAPWGAVEVYQLTHELPLPHYLICYPDRLVEIMFDCEPTTEQMRTVTAKLNG